MLKSNVVAHISQDRFSTYLSAAGHDADHALLLYAWNMRVAASFYPLLSSIEVCLRNQIESRICEVYSPAWWEDEGFHELLGSKGKGRLLRTRNKIRDRGQEATAGRMTAELSFGFWVNMLLVKYEPELWVDIHAHFPSLPEDADLASLRDLAQHQLDLRNRISHHEPVFERDLSKDYSDGIKLMKWIGPAKVDWIKPQLDIMRILREKP